MGVFRERLVHMTGPDPFSLLLDGLESLSEVSRKAMRRIHLSASVRTAATIEYHSLYIPRALPIVTFDDLPVLFNKSGPTLCHRVKEAETMQPIDRCPVCEPECGGYRSLLIKSEERQLV
jgi:hypothetical protein